MFSNNLNILNESEDIKVKLIGAMPRESYVDIAATFTRSEKDMEEIVAMPYNEELVKKVVNMSHLATTEFDYFVFAVEGVSRVVETQLVRKRLASYLIKSGRVQKGGKRSFDIVRPRDLKDAYFSIKLNPAQILINDSENLERMLGRGCTAVIDLTFAGLMDIIAQWYNEGVRLGYKEESLRYAKPQGTEWKGLVAMNGHAWLDWLKIRVCNNAQIEHQSLAKKFLVGLKEHSPALFSNAGASCKVLGYCPENSYQCEQCKGSIPTHEDVKEMIKSWRVSSK